MSADRRWHFAEITRAGTPREELTMISVPAVSDHYRRGDLLQRISGGVEKLGKTPGSVSIEDLAAVD